MIVTRAAHQPDSETMQSELPDFRPEFSHLVTLARAEHPAGFHVMETGPALEAQGLTPHATIVAVHGNPTWSYLWRALLNTTYDRAVSDPQRYPVLRVIAPDQRDMGFSDRLAHRGLPRHSGNGDDYLALEDRITDLQELLTVLIPEAEHPVFTLGHDWGGVISLGAALRAHQAGSHHLAGLMTLNTAVHQSEDDPLPAPLRCAIH